MYFSCRSKSGSPGPPNWKISRGVFVPCERIIPVKAANCIQRPYSCRNPGFWYPSGQDPAKKPPMSAFQKGMPHMDKFSASWTCSFREVQVDSRSPDQTCAP